MILLSLEEFDSVIIEFDWRWGEEIPPIYNSCLPVVGDKSYLMVAIPSVLHKGKNQLVVCNEQLLARSGWWWPVTSQNCQKQNNLYVILD
jgi:hypothetical protein